MVTLRARLLGLGLGLILISGGALAEPPAAANIHRHHPSSLPSTRNPPTPPRPLAWLSRNARATSASTARDTVASRRTTPSPA